MIKSKMSAEAQEQYCRQIFFLGEENQELLRSKRVLVLGAGGLGSPVLYYLAGAGIGELLISDFDVVSLSNLNRQILHNHERLGMNKALSALKTLKLFNPDIKISIYENKFSTTELLELAKTVDLLIEVTDSMDNKELVNKTIVREKINCIYAILVGMAGFCFLYTDKTACWHCLFKPAPLFPNGSALPFDYYPSFGAAAGFLGSFIANIAVRYLIGHAGPVLNKIFYSSQLLPFKKLQISSRGIKTIMTDHLKKTFTGGNICFPESDRFFNEHQTCPDPYCEICSQ